MENTNTAGVGYDQCEEREQFAGVLWNKPAYTV